jgi:hypothetical protein
VAGGLAGEVHCGERILKPVGLLMEDGHRSMQGGYMQFQAYHGVSAAEHQTKFNNLVAQGYQMISLSVYGDPGNALYAAVWVQRSGPGWQAVHGVDSNGYQSFFNTWTAKGYVPVLVSATGTSSNAVFAAVFEQGISGPWLAKHGMPSGSASNAGTFQNENTQHHDSAVTRSQRWLRRHANGL